MKPCWDLLGFGAVAVDDLLYVDHYPPPNSKTEVRAVDRQGGGLTGTALVAAARLGATTAYAGVLGDDDLSRYTIAELTREGVDCSPVLRRAEARPIHSVIIVDRATGGRNIFFSMADVIQRPPEAMTADLIGRCRALFVDHKGIPGTLRAIELAHEHHIPVIGDVEGEPTPELLDLMGRIDHLVIGHELAGRVTGAAEPADMVAALASPRRRGPQRAADSLLGSPGRVCIAVTAGERGCWWSERGGPVRYTPALRVQVVDTTGCGDVFHGAYAACIARGESVERSIRVATVTAGLKATRPGGRAGIPDRATVERVLAEMEPQMNADERG